MVSQTGTPSMFHVWLPSHKKVNTFRQVGFIPSNNQTLFDMYLLLDLIIFEPEPLDTSTTDFYISTTVTEKPTTPPLQSQVMPGSWGTPTPSKLAPSLPPHSSIREPSIVIPRHSKVNSNDYLTIKEQKLSYSERAAS